jgi:excisionase family DNA binding protein
MTKPTIPPGYLTTNEVARHVGISERSVRNAADRKELPCIQAHSGVRIFSREDVMAWYDLVAPRIAKREEARRAKTEPEEARA